jgi:hypothetical protein
MAVSSRFIQVHPDALVEWIWDDQFYYEDEYSIIRDIQNNVTSFAFSKTANDALNYNKIPQQLYLIDSLINKYGIADPSSKAFLQESKYANNQPSKFDKVKIWFPIHYTFPNSTGFMLKLSGLNYENSVPYNLANYFLDITVPGELTKIENESQPFRLNERLWGKSVTIYVPSLYDESRNRANNAPTLGTINYNITSGVLGLSQTSPIFIDFRYLSSKSTILGETTYLATPPLVANIPQAPEYNNLGVNIEEAADGDYYVINGIYNGSVGEFEVFMSALEQSGKRSYILYTITPSEENIPQEPLDIYVYQDFLKKISYRPIFKVTNTTAGIRVDMKIINAADSSVVTKSSELAIVGNAVAKYGRYVTSINVSGAIKPKLYNSKSDSIVLPPMELLNSHLKRKVNNKKTDIKYIPYPVLTDVHNIIAQDVSKANRTGAYSGFGDLSLTLTPFDNIVKIKIAKEVTQNGITPFVFPSSNSIIQMIFKSATAELRVPLYIESNEVNLAGGVLVFKITSTSQSQLKKIYQVNKNFYITITTNGIETSVYDGVFTLLEETPRVVKGLTSATNDTRDLTRPVLAQSIKSPALSAILNLPAQFNQVPAATSFIKQLTNTSLSKPQLSKLK